MKVGIITQTTGNRDELLERCKQSVSVAIAGLDNVTHIVEKCGKNWHEGRVRLARDFDVVVYVDDDDFIEQTAIRTCLDKIHNVGLVCSNETLVRIDGSTIRESVTEKTYTSAVIHPQGIHHICMMRTSEIDFEGATELHNRFGIGIDWFIRASIAHKNECAHIKKSLYFWTQHEGQHSRETNKLYGESVFDMSRAIRERWAMQRLGPFISYES